MPLKYKQWILAGFVGSLCKCNVYITLFILSTLPILSIMSNSALLSTSIVSIFDKNKNKKHFHFPQPIQLSFLISHHSLLIYITSKTTDIRGISTSYHLINKQKLTERTFWWTKEVRCVRLYHLSLFRNSPDKNLR